MYPPVTHLTEKLFSGSINFKPQRSLKVLLASNPSFWWHFFTDWTFDCTPLLFLYFRVMLCVWYLFLSIVLMTILVLSLVVIDYSCPCLYHTVLFDDTVYFSLLLDTWTGSSLGKYKECHCEHSRTCLWWAYLHFYWRNIKEWSCWFMSVFVKLR